MSRAFQVYGIGNAIVDLQFQVTDQDQQSLAAEKATMRLVSPEEQKVILDALTSRRHTRSSGGSVINSMIVLGQLQGRGAVGCSVGDDEFGHFFLGEMKELGLELRTTPRPSFPTGTSAILITPDAERTMRTSLGASALFGPEHIHEDLLARSEYLFIEGYLFAQDLAREGIAKAVEIAKRNGVKVATTVSDAFIVNVFGEQFRKVVSQCDLLFANADEARALAGVEDESLAFQRLRELVPNVAMTRGSQGAWVALASGEEARIPGYEVRSVDHTGAGDVFAGAFLYGLTHGYSVERAGRLACFLASRVVSQFGARLTGDVRSLAQAGAVL